MRTLGLILVLLLACAGVLAQEAPGVTLLHPLPDADPQLAATFGAHVQRTMTLLATSTPTHRNHVRILVYGQSISEGKWWTEVERDLRQRFPNADLEMVNRALGGHASNYLVREMETDLMPYYPDLVIFHVYGGHTCYEQIISRIRSRTTAELLMTTDHLGAGEKVNDKGVFVDDNWTTFMASFIAKVADRYGCERVDVRAPWKRYVVDNKMVAQDLLLDGIHLNPYGNGLYAGLIKRQLVYRPEMKIADAGTVRTLVVGKDIKWKRGKLTLEFTGNRVDVIAQTADANAPAALVTIDGKKPSEFAGAFGFTRAYGAGTKVLCIKSEKAPLVEDWVLRITDIDKDAKKFTYEAIGSKTGADGKGSSDHRFVSNSGRIVIETRVEKPEMGFESDFPGNVNTMSVGDEVKFQCYALNTDRYTAPALADPTKEYSTILAQGIPNGKHTLELSADAQGNVPISAIRVYCPPVAEDIELLYHTVHPPK